MMDVILDAVLPAVVVVAVYCAGLAVGCAIGRHRWNDEQEQLRIERANAFAEFLQKDPPVR